MSFLWGVQDGGNNIFVFQSLGFEFESKSESFGVLCFLQGITVFTMQNVASLLDTESKE